MKSQSFDENDGLTALEKCQFCCFLNLCFHSLEWLFSIYKKNAKIVLSRSIITIYYIVKQVVTEGYKGLQGIIKRCSNILETLLEHQQTLFLDLFLINTSDEKKFTFLTKIIV